MTAQPLSPLDARAPLGAQWRAFQATKSFDLLAAFPLVTWYGSSAIRKGVELAVTLARADAATLNLHLVLTVLAQTAAVAMLIAVPVFLILRAPAKAKAQGLLPRIAAIAGTYLGIAVVWLPEVELSATLSTASLLLILGGVGFAFYALMHLGRAFSLMAEARHLVTDGPYKIVRHPLYLGEAISMLGLTLQYALPAAFAILFVQLGFQIMRMNNEERVLSGLFPEYRAFAARTARLVPGVY